ncbi:hypothetical protein GCM10023210_08900 [Chryseobacterium ginsengisoli]|uniref:Uncharacterized protein n=1 Tax=Chryseobacterium ginsengisoli TaxID=363853 RepID=A0ABP9LW81_9FLAO
MKLFLSLFLFGLSFTSFAQTKDQLIQSIIDYNVLDSDCIGIACSKSPQYENFQKLKKMISKEELLELSKHQNPVLRTYIQIELINTGHDVPKILSYELSRNDTIDTQDGCLGNFDLTSEIVYKTYRGKVLLGSITKNDDEKTIQVKIKKAIEQDSTMKILDSIMIYSDQELSNYRYLYIFENRKFDVKDLPQIEKMAFKKNNFFAFKYLISNNPEYQSKIENYLQNDFINANFESYNKAGHIEAFIKYLLETNKNEYKNIAIDKLRKDKSWKEFSHFMEGILKEHHINPENI